jgi:hypothetical protein
MFLHDEGIAPGEVLRAGEQPDLQAVQHGLFCGRKGLAFASSHAARLKKFRPVVPQNRVTSSPTK